MSCVTVTITALVAGLVFPNHLKPARCRVTATATTEPRSLRLVPVGKGIGTLLAHERGAGLGGAGLLGLGAGKGGGLCAGLELLLVAALAAAGKGQEGDGDDDGDAKDDGDDDAANVEAVLLLHADGLAEGVHGAHEARGAVGLGHLGGDAGYRLEDAPVGGDVARRRLDGGGDLALEVAAVADPVGGQGRGVVGVAGGERLDGAAEDAAVALLEIAHVGELVAPLLRVLCLGGGLGQGAAGVGVAGLEVAGGVVVGQRRQAVLERDVLAAVRVLSELLAVLGEASGLQGERAAAEGEGSGAGELHGGLLL